MPNEPESQGVGQNRWKVEISLIKGGKWKNISQTSAAGSSSLVVVVSKYLACLKMRRMTSVTFSRFPVFLQIVIGDNVMVSEDFLKSCL